MSSKTDYSAQRRGDRGAYERYLSGMDTSMRQKVALTAAHLRAEGRVADMGMGSGTGSEALASLYPALDVVGVDVEPTMVELAREKYALRNLSFTVGDIATKVFDDETLDGILNSSVLHHVTSFGGYQAERAAQALRTQSKQLRDGGILIVRDFLAPKEQHVLLDLPDNDGAEFEDLSELSSAALFVKFAERFRPLSDAPGFSYEEVGGEDVPQGWKRFRVSAVHAVEFVLRKDYRRDWESELLEEYTYFSQEQFESTYANMGFRVLASTPIHNPWIVQNRFEGKFAWKTDAGEPLEFPATNYIIVGEKVSKGHGVRFAEGKAAEANGFLTLEYYRDRRTGAVRDLARRPNRTIDVLPWFEVDGDCFLLARASYPRPIICAEGRGTVSLDDRHSSGYVIEPLVTIQSDKPLGMTVEDVLARDAQVEPLAIQGFRKGSSYYPSPGGIQEEVRACFVQITPSFGQSERTSGSGRVLPIEAQQVLRAAQVGGLPDSRLELGAYDLLLERGRSCGPWLGQDIRVNEALSTQLVDAGPVRERRRVFEAAKAEDSTGFLQVACASFEELDSDGQVRAGMDLEFVVPSVLSLNTVAVAVVAKSGDELWIGVDDDDLPAAQGFEGHSELYVAPAWRLPKSIQRMSEAKAWVGQRLLEEYGVTACELSHLGGPYYPSLGLTPEIVHPLFAAVSEIGEAERTLRWMPMSRAIHERAELKDGHLRTVLLRSAHALGLLTGEA